MLKTDGCEHAWTGGIVPVLFCFNVLKSWQLTVMFFAYFRHICAFIRKLNLEFTCLNCVSVEIDGNGTAGAACCVTLVK